MNDKIVIKGKLSNDFVCDTCEQPQDIDKEAIISLSPPTPAEIEKLKEGDEVLVKYKIKSTEEGGYCLLSSYDFMFPIKDIVAILPQPQQFCLCKIPTCQIAGKDYNPNFCFHCWKVIKPLRPQKEIESLYGIDLQHAMHSHARILDIIHKIIDKQTELIKSHNEQIRS